ncbi:tonB-system energizer ExbB [Rhizobium sp. ARZ01]|nr:tonB-system energizer ExbB [Rhizobium sp. ARZ01]MBD9372139.1 tonB-system energizer ExbB [Rhizobium sp. ARZ01]
MTVIGLVFCSTPGHAQEGAASSVTSTAHTQDRPSTSSNANTGPGVNTAASSVGTATAVEGLEIDTLSSETVAPGVQQRPDANDTSTGTEGERQSGLPHDLSPWGMFLAADVVVKAVMIGLAFASVATWTVLIAKIVELATAQRSVRRAIADLTAAQGLAVAEQIFAGRQSVPAHMVAAARAEMNSSEAVLDHVSDAGVKERVASRLQRMEVQAARRIAKGTGLLATIGSTAPFVGLFGTVWGIMNSFIGISKAQTTNLAIVAPGIAEALLATAIGLVAAIPAVVIYNFLARAITGYRQGLTDTSAAIERLVSRDLDVRRSKLAAFRPSGSTRPDPTLVRVG